MTRCLECGGKVNKVENPKPYQYTECGLKIVYLAGIVVYECQSCHTKYPEIPNMDGLHSFIAGQLVKKPFSLSGEEFRFLRKEMHMKSKELASLLGVSATTVSRWENNEEHIGKANDRLIRSLYILWQLKHGAIVDPKTILEQIRTNFESIKAKPRRVSIHVPANPQLVEA